MAEMGAEVAGSSSAAAPRRKSLLSKLALLVGVLLLALLVGEVACRVRIHLLNRESMDPTIAEKRRAEHGGRVALIDIIQSSDDPKIVYDLKPNLHAVPFKNAPTSTNSRGFRYREVQPDEGPDVVTIIGLGDSIMFGWGVPDGRMYTAYLEHLLNEKYPRKTWRVINTAAPGYNTVIEVETLRAKGLEFKPDLVILDLVPNDLELPVYVFKPRNVFALDRSFLLRWVDERLAAGATGRGVDLPGRDLMLEPGRQVDADDPIYRNLFGWKNFIDALDELRELSQQHGFKVVSFTTVENATTDEMTKHALEHGTMHVRLLPELSAYLDQKYDHPVWSFDQPEALLRSDLVVSPDDGHPSVKQHYMAAEKLLSALEASGDIERLLR
jgi:hypothetical protein